MAGYFSKRRVPTSVAPKPAVPTTPGKDIHLPSAKDKPKPSVGEGLAKAYGNYKDLKKRGVLGRSPSKR